MLYGIKSVTKYLLGRDIADRDVAVYQDDTFLVSYPRSGNTWTRFLIANLRHPEIEVGFANIENLVPDTAALSNRTLKRIRRPRILKSHQYFDPRYPKVLYIVRDPRDVAVSYYHFHRKYGFIQDDSPLEKFVTDFVAGKLVSADWGTWAENVASWYYTRRGNPNFMLVRYEELKDDTQTQLARVARFLGVDPTHELLGRAISQSSAERMRQLEHEQRDQWVGTRKHRDDIPFVGRASAGSWRESLPAECVAQIESAWGELMQVLGYEISNTQRLAENDASKELLPQRI